MKTTTEEVLECDDINAVRRLFDPKTPLEHQLAWAICNLWVILKQMPAYSQKIAEDWAVAQEPKP
jgi:hypothetical protein